MLMAKVKSKCLGCYIWMRVEVLFIHGCNCFRLEFMSWPWMRWCTDDFLSHLCFPYWLFQIFYVVVHRYSYSLTLLVIEFELRQLTDHKIWIYIIINSLIYTIDMMNADCKCQLMYFYLHWNAFNSICSWVIQKL